MLADPADPESDFSFKAGDNRMYDLAYNINSAEYRTFDWAKNFDDYDRVTEKFKKLVVELPYMTAYCCCYTCY